MEEAGSAFLTGEVPGSILGFLGGGESTGGKT